MPSTSSRGAASELIVCADLLQKGYEVFRSVSLNCSCDLIAMRNGGIERIEVKTVQTGADGIINGSTLLTESKYDVLAVVYADTSVVAYFPVEGAARELIPTRPAAAPTRFMFAAEYRVARKKLPAIWRSQDLARVLQFDSRTAQRRVANWRDTGKVEELTSGRYRFVAESEAA